MNQPEEYESATGGGDYDSVVMGGGGDSVSSAGTDHSAMQVLARMMQSQAALVQAMAAMGAMNGAGAGTSAPKSFQEPSNPDISHLEREKQELARQVLALQEQLNRHSSPSMSNQFQQQQQRHRVGSIEQAQFNGARARVLPGGGNAEMDLDLDSIDGGGSRSSAGNSPRRYSRSLSKRSVHSSSGSVNSRGGGGAPMAAAVPLSSSSAHRMGAMAPPIVIDPAGDDEFSEYRQSQSILSGPPQSFANISAMVGDDEDISVTSYGDRSARSARSARSMKSARSLQSAGVQSAKSSRSFQSVRSARSQRSSLASSARRKKKGFEAPLPEYIRPENPPGSQAWRSLAFLCTFFVPDVCINRVGPGAKQAWREKVTICMIAMLASAIVVGGIGFLPVYMCRGSDFYTEQEIWKQERKAWITVFGKIYDMKGYVDRHPGGRKGILDFLGNDASRLFPRLPPARLPVACLNTSKSEFLLENIKPTCPLLTREDELKGVPCHDTLVGKSTFENRFRSLKTADLVIPAWRRGDNGRKWIQIGKTIYDITQYMDGLSNRDQGVFNDTLDHPAAYLTKELHIIVTSRPNSDVTDLYNLRIENPNLRLCLDELFFEGLIDDRFDELCAGVGVFMYVFLFFVVGMLTVQVLCSLVYLFRRHRNITEEDLQPAIMIMVPCYNEGEGELRKTITSCLLSTYPEDNRCLVVVADGVITGHGEKYSTPEICARLLEFEIDWDDDPTYHYRSIGKMRDNYASVYTGVYEKEIEEKLYTLKYVVIVKRGAPSERGGGRPGNRGKRDSQLVITGMLNRIHHNREPSELDMAFVKALFNLGLPAKDIEYLMCIDADTRVHKDALAHMVFSLEKNKKVLACCGETQVDNKAQSWVTMIQVFEYFSAHHLKKAFESVFGCVTCLPGCFSMYRIYTEDMKCLIGDDQIFIDYSRNDIPSLHEKNLFELGEDRMLTTLLLQRFPGMSLSYVPEAVCWTIVPHNMTILLSQRRRWINSTFHNMYELMKVQTMCGICILSMKTVVIMDLIVTMTLPASLVYVIYLAYLFITQPQTIDQFVLVIYGVGFSLQMFSFLFRSRYDYLWWFSIFCVLGIPIFYFVLPIYSFINMDDFSWGKTRQVGASEKPKTDEPENDDGEGGDNEIDDDALSTSDSSEAKNSKAMSRNGAGGSLAGSHVLRSVPITASQSNVMPPTSYRVDDNATLGGESYSGYSLGASTIQTTMTPAASYRGRNSFPLQLEQANPQLQDLVSIPDDFSVDYDDDDDEPKPKRVSTKTQMDQKDIESFRAFL